MNFNKYKTFVAHALILLLSSFLLHIGTVESSPLECALNRVIRTSENLPLQNRSYTRLIDEAYDEAVTPFLRGVKSSDDIITKITSSIDEAISSGEMYGHKLKVKEIESLKHERDILQGVQDNPALLKELEINGFDLKNYLQGTYQSDLGKLKPYIDLLTEKSAKSDILLDFLKGKGPPDSANALKEVHEEMGHKGALLSSQMDNAAIREVFKNNPILTGYLHEFPGMSEAVLAFEKGLISKADFKKQLAANLFHNGPSKGFWQLLEDAFIPGAALGANQQNNVAGLFQGTVFDISQGTGSVVRPTYQNSYSFESFVGTFMDRMSQGTRGGYRKIDAEIPGDPLDNIINLGGQTSIGGTRAQIDRLRELASNATHLTDAQRLLIKNMANAGIKYLDEYLERSNQALITARDLSGNVIRGGPFSPTKVPELSIRHNDSSGQITRFVRNEDGSYLYQITKDDEVVSSRTLPSETAGDDIRGIYDQFLARDEALYGDPMRDLYFNF
jgi:hypothetical protein